MSTGRKNQTMSARTPSFALLLAILAVCAAVCSSSKEPNTCKYPDDSMSSPSDVLKGITWDLGGLTLSDGEWYGAHDKDNNDTQHLMFYFNICGSLQKSDVQKCIKDQAGPNSGSAPAAWVYVKHDSCHKLGEYPRVNKLLSYHVDPHDKLRPAAGVNLWYKLGGERGIDDCGSHENAELKVAVLCGGGNRHTTEKLEKNKVNTNMFVDKVGKCSYEVHVIDPAGCPKECPIVNGEVCSSNGHCAYDRRAREARCFCEDGYKGKDCTTSPGRSSAGAVGAVFGGIFIGLVGVVGFWYYRQRWTGKKGFQPKEDDDEGFY
eukprot:gb/GECG01006356.1/.p1 GENE.gb/GECG01006356.1/~~gb/GECG01006356.1/.p1  ORF type:complete len:319 (+),score=33.77 gb/GECG01006356.1/:1-957(+)